MRSFQMDITGQEWRSEARCALPEYRLLPWFPPTGVASSREARRNRAAVMLRLRAVCRACPVQAECRQFAEDAHVSSGVWAGKNYGRAYGAKDAL